VEHFDLLNFPRENLDEQMPQQRKGIVKPRRKSFYQEYNFEITVIILIALGVFLLVEDLEIKHYIYEFVKVILLSIGDFIKMMRDGTLFIVDIFEVSDMVGISLILFALFLVANRWRERMIERYSSLSDCPKCGGNLHRIQRNQNQRFTSMIYFVTVKHYHCKACDYKGIKMAKR
jgi:hypothetical protein